MTSSLAAELSVVVNTIKKSQFDDENINVLEQQYQKILDDMQSFDEILSEYRKNITKYLRQAESSYMSESYKMYENSRTQDRSEYILDRSLFHALIYRDEINDVFINCIKSHSSWHHPGLFIRPEHGKYVNEMTASDPLYIVDETEKLLSPVKKLWNKQYQSRVRYGLINEDHDVIFKSLAETQLGLVVAMNFLNHKPLEIIKRYLTEIYSLLKPGGIFVFTYNNCDNPLAVKNFEKSLYSYTPGALLKGMVALIGFEITTAFDEETTNVSWLELKKPGTLKTLRGGQSLAKINNKG
jgi:SAM-dependent methyltransferase